MNQRTLENAPAVADYLQQIQAQEASRHAEYVPGTALSLADDALVVDGQPFQMTAEANADLAGLAGIPIGYYHDLDAELRATNVNRRLPGRLKANERLAVVRNDTGVLRIRRGGHRQMPLSQIVEAVLEQAPSDAVRNGIRAVEYANNGHVDLTLVAPELNTEPRRGDIVCGGVQVFVEESGAIQLMPVTFRLVCSNGATARVCLDGRHSPRIRRGNGRDSERLLRENVWEFARAAWGQWDAVRRGMAELAALRLAPEFRRHLTRRLRESPFFISARVARLVSEQLEGPPDGELTFYDLHNAITRVGTHPEEFASRENDPVNIPWRYAYRLRLGAGQLSNRNVSMCGECKRLRLA